ncbi:TolB-like protein [Flavobacteriaceae bacterium MAR_2010_72]|nr:TolB-like protein [Flavobacteriaceae bacterium MAR_2010_72]
MNLKNYFKELKRRNVIKAALAYLIVAWLVIQVLSVILPAFEAPPYLLKSALIILFIGFPIWIVFSWIYEFTPEGLKKTIDVEPERSMMSKTGSRINKVIIFALSLAVIVLVIDRLINEPVKVLDYGEKGIAVLAFADMSPQQDHEYFSDGISEELLNILVRIPKLKVISRTSSFSYKGKNKTAIEIGNELNVSHILEGSIRKSGNTVRITAQLINTSDGSHEWSQTFDRDMTDIFKIQDEIANAVTEQLKISLLGDEIKTKPVKPEAYNLYLQALHLAYQNTKEAYITAEDLVKKAIDIEPEYADAWRLLAGIYETGMYNLSIREPKEGIPLGLEAAEKAVKLDPNSGSSYITLASLQRQNWDFDQSAVNVRKALEIDPNNAIIYGTVANMTFGNLNESLEHLHKSLSLDPSVTVNYYNLGFTYYRLNQLDKAEEAFNTFTIYYPNSQILHYMKAKVYTAQGRYDEALNEIELETHEFFNLYGKNYVFYESGKERQADSLFNLFKKKYEKSDPSMLADLYALRGDFDKSFYYLNKALEIKNPDLLEALTYPTFKPMHKDMRWKTLINKIGLPKDHGFHLN